MDVESLNLPRWPAVSGGEFHEVWFVSASDSRAGRGLWLRYTVEMRPHGRTCAVWAAWFDRDRPDRCIALKNDLDAAAIGRTAVDLGGNVLSAAGCSGEVEGAGHSLRWRLSFGQGAQPEDFVPLWLSPLARLRGSGYALPRPATAVSGAVEVDGHLIDVQRMSAGQAHYWGRSHWPAWAWARCSGFSEDAEASLDLLDVEGPAGARLPLFIFRFRGKVHRFGELPWMARCTSQPVAPAWHFSAEDAGLAIDGVAHASPGQMVQVTYGDALHCANTEIASVEVRVRTRAVLGAPWRPEVTLTSKHAASLEFCGRTPDLRVPRGLVAVPAVQKEARPAGSVAS